MLDVQGNALLAGALPASIQAQARPTAWWNRYDASLGQWQGPAQFSSVNVVSVDDAAYANSPTREVRVQLVAGGAGQAAMVIDEAVPVSGDRCFGDAAARLWGSSLR